MYKIFKFSEDNVKTLENLVFVILLSKVNQFSNFYSTSGMSSIN